jgi:hypothetical protein
VPLSSRCSLRSPPSLSLTRSGVAPIPSLFSFFSRRLPSVSRDRVAVIRRFSFPDRSPPCPCETRHMPRQRRTFACVMFAGCTFVTAAPGTRKGGTTLNIRRRCDD